MKNYAKLIKLTLIVVTSTIMFSCSDDESNNDGNTIAAIASKNSNLSILVDALERADLSLDRNGSFTVFAPTNDAFIQFLDDNNYNSLDEVPVSALRQILLNHMVTGVNLSTDLTTGYIKTLAKGSASSTNMLSMYVNTESGVRLNGVADVTTADIIASNGVIHVVNAVIGLPTIVTHALANPNLTTLVSLLVAQDLVTTLSGRTSSPFTVFAPINSAFNIDTLDYYTSLSSEEKTAVLTYHVVAGANVLSSGIPTTPITTLQGGTFTIAGTVITDELLRTTNILTSALDIQASNGVIHAVDNVLLPVFN